MTNDAHVAEQYQRICAAKGRKLDLAQLGVWNGIVGGESPSILRMATDQRLKVEGWWPDAGDLLSTVKRIEAESGSTTKEPEHWRRHTVKCKQCQDTGYVTIWATNAMSAALAVVRGAEDERRKTNDERRNTQHGRLET